jgi:hypothetical protein
MSAVLEYAILTVGLIDAMQKAPNRLGRLSSTALMEKSQPLAAFFEPLRRRHPRLPWLLRSRTTARVWVAPEVSNPGTLCL